MEPSVIEFAIGETVHKAPLRLIHTAAAHGQPAMWTLRKDQADQRDDTDVISGLTDETILRMAEAVHRRRGKR